LRKSASSAPHKLSVFNIMNADELALVRLEVVSLARDAL
jgi:hypothetical protein